MRRSAPHRGLSWCALARAPAHGARRTTDRRTAGATASTGGHRGGRARAPTAPEFVAQIGCKADFQALASAPLDANLPGARSVKVVLDQADGDTLYFQNSSCYQIHYEFVSTHLSGDGCRWSPRSPSSTRPSTTRPTAASSSAR